ncbi:MULTISPECIES: hypothetical protein [Paenibacillus]|uniref:hypothetical protein n=1 Tax=Paenibacillus TaxID=44249 RepID=UPI0003E244E2|nr:MULTISPECIES: hypothetical protein [Paenibacillus]ETT67476.1 PpiC-type peptidyl-prolyl cis-trans isomerase [Paenibacillus sp. FSL H8-237]OMD10984.1 hypothetical protein BJP50_03750 [Paenibacillus odorifer]OMD28533.1 hypothetical protein BJP48_02085 [Paenibacillus odorifer]OME58095.1 hypothetical protein BSK66_13560 [Paenibacillus odorifer]OZQ79662.1 hypothetical protein CA596_00985 [Paenibacillus odorifer]
MGITRRKPTVIILFTALIVLALLMLGLTNKKAELPENWIFTVDGYAVTEEEFHFYVTEQRAVTADYFFRTYGAQVDEGFWTRKYGKNHETPSEYAKNSAMTALLKTKQEQFIADERGIAPYKSFDELESDMDDENVKRAKMDDSGETYYGLPQFDLYQYMQYLSGARWPDLVETQVKKTKMSNAELQVEYASKSAEYTRVADKLTAALATTGQAKEEKVLNRLDISKEDTESLKFWESLAAASVGETVIGKYMDEDVIATLITKPEITKLKLEEVKDSIIYEWAESDLRALITNTNKLKIVYNGNRFSELVVN